MSQHAIPADLLQEVPPRALAESRPRTLRGGVRDLNIAILIRKGIGSRHSWIAKRLREMPSASGYEASTGMPDGSRGHPA
ncbi:hypothetical protein [Burkholderia sp. WAC0059]|uniref:hypothetical protein n=1 Tax=Burkholderia sp. WAC0059 TaxID=2066022 RepID=UPI0011AEC856|nr:hypothetical protein [Burkholderia sp. WAC0059]